MPRQLVSAAQAEPAVAQFTDSNSPAPGQTLAEMSSPPSNGAALVEATVAGDKPAPPNIRPASPLAEVIKLEQAGLEQSVVLAYVTNSTSTFNLGSDEIIYLTDLGVSDEVVTAMIQRDQALKDLWTNPAQGSTASAAGDQLAPTVAGTPGYSTSAPESEPQAAESTPPAYAGEPPAQQPQEANVSYNYFYGTLSPYGNWINVDGYGPCWQPTVVVANPDWRPYCDRGRWVYSDCGWYWLSDYSWGWAPFHYGRWFRHARWGWCWTPGTVWGPAWVTWRYSDDYCGWAPLPPAAYFRPGFGFFYHNASVGIGFDFGLTADWFAFVPYRHFCDYRPYRYRLPHNQVTAIYNHTTIINNIATGNNNTIINHGIPPERITRVTRTEIRRVTIQDANSIATRRTRPERLDPTSRTLTVYRPHLSRPVAATGTAAPQSTGGGVRRDSPASAVAAPSGQPQSAPRAVRRPIEPPRSAGDTRNGGIHAGPDVPRVMNRSERAAPADPAAPTANQQNSPRAPSANPQAAPPNSSIIVGRRDATPTHGQNQNPAAPPAQNNSSGPPGNQNPPRQRSFTPTPQTQLPATAPSYSGPAYQQPRFDRQEQRPYRPETPGISRGIEDRYGSRPALPQPRTYSPPPVVDRPQYSPPTAVTPPVRSEPAMAPRSAPAPAPQVPDRPQSGGAGSSRQGQDHDPRSR